MVSVASAELNEASSGFTLGQASQSYLRFHDITNALFGITIFVRLFIRDHFICS